MGNRPYTGEKLPDRPATDEQQPRRVLLSAGGPVVLPRSLETILHAMQYLDLQSPAIAPSTGFKIDTPAVRGDSYWYVQACCVESLSEGNVGQSAANILLCPPGAADPNLSVAIPAVTAGIRLDSQNSVTGGNVSQNPNGVSVTRAFIVPPKWFVRFLGATAAAGGPFKYAFRMCYAELPLTLNALELLT